MIDGVDSEIVNLILRLFPGFVAAWIFYGLTAHDRPSPFERVIQALVFSVIIQAINIAIRETALLAGLYVQLGEWTEDSDLVCSVALAVATGLLFVRFANNGSVHEWLRRWHWWDRQRRHRVLRWVFCFEWNWTSRTSFPSEWYSAFAREKRLVILHLTGSRRLCGWPEEWPDRPDRGHFLILNAAWLLDNGQIAPLYKVAKILIPASEVAMVEFLKDEPEISVSPDELSRVEQILIDANREERQHGSKVPPRAAD